MLGNNIFYFKLDIVQSVKNFFLQWAQVNVGQHKQQIN